MWGEQTPASSDNPHIRTIPTRVGRTWVASVDRFIAPDHPHACGENSAGTLVTAAAIGPSPRVWGEHNLAQRLAEQRRTIPTRVGRTGADARAADRAADHPHACGENDFTPQHSNVGNGPSPRVWGERMPTGLDVHVLRTIPTRVGRTTRVRRLATCGTDHPHACGENAGCGHRAGLGDGPSPRVWGERRISIRSCSFSRTIPTRVGRTRL